MDSANVLWLPQYGVFAELCLLAFANTFSFQQYTLKARGHLVRTLLSGASFSSVCVRAGVCVCL